MRKLPLLFAPATLAVLGLMACEDDSSLGGGPSFGLDSGLSDWSPPPTFDATASETGPETGPDAPAVPQISVTVTDSFGPRSSVRVVFHDAAGAVIETKLTGNDGKAIHTGTTPAMVSALLARGAQRHIVTWTGVENGDDLQVRDGDSGEGMGLYFVSMPTLDDAANRYFIDGPCSSNHENYGTATELPMYRYCTRAQNAVLVTARTFSGTTTSHAFKKGSPAITDGGTVAVTTGAWTAPTPLALTVANLPANVSYNDQLLEIADGTGFDNRWGRREGSTTTYPTATGFADAYQASVLFDDNGPARSLTKRFAPGAGAALDYNTLLPAITEASMDAVNPRRPILSWASEAPTTATDGGLVTITFRGPEDANYAWTFVVAPGATTVTGPAMPPEAESFLPFAADSGVPSFFSIPSVLFLEADVLPNYASFRRQQGTLLGLNNFGFGGYMLPALSTNGTYKTTSYLQHTE